jgi:hypothetical protein
LTPAACGDLSTALETGIVNPSGGSPYGYCSADGGILLGQDVNPCTNCLMSLSDASYLSNCTSLWSSYAARAYHPYSMKISWRKPSPSFYCLVPRYGKSRLLANLPLSCGSAASWLQSAARGRHGHWSQWLCLYFHPSCNHDCLSRNFHHGCVSTLVRSQRRRNNWNYRCRHYRLTDHHRGLHHLV